MSAIKLSTGVISKIMRGVTVDAPIFQLLAYKKVKALDGDDRYRLRLSDGVHSQEFGMLSPDLNYMISDQKLAPFDVIRGDKIITNYVNQHVRVVIVSELTILSTPGNTALIGTPVPWTTENAHISECAALEESIQGPSIDPNFISNNSEVSPGAMKRSLSPTEPAKRRQGVLSPSVLQSGQPLIVPIAVLKIYNTSSTIRARVTYKTPIREYTNSRGNGKTFSFHLVDFSGEIKGCCFNEQVDKFYDILEAGRVYYISKFGLQPSNPQFNTLGHAYEMTLNRHSKIYPCCTDTEDVPLHIFKFVKIRDLEQKPGNSIVDIIGICKSVSDVATVTQRSTKEMIAKRDLVLVDRSSREIAVTLWGKQAEEFVDKTHPVIAIKGAKVSEYNGKSLTLLMSSVFLVNPNIKEGHDLQTWFKNIGLLAPTVSLSTAGSSKASPLKKLQ